jgi:hypothetical protein
MTSPLERIELYPQESKRLIGVKYEDFIILVALAEKRHLEKQAEIEKTKIRLIASGGGRKAEMTPKQGVCLCLVYLRQKPTFVCNFSLNQPQMPMKCFNCIRHTIFTPDFLTQLLCFLPYHLIAQYDFNRCC